MNVRKFSNMHCQWLLRCSRGSGADFLRVSTRRTDQHCLPGCIDDAPPQGDLTFLRTFNPNLSITLDIPIDWVFIWYLLKMRSRLRNSSFGLLIGYTVGIQHHHASHVRYLWPVVLGEIESYIYRNKTQKEMEIGLKPLFERYMPLYSNTAAQAGRGVELDLERKKDHYSHFILRLAFCRSYVPCWCFLGVELMST